MRHNLSATFVGALPVPAQDQSSEAGKHALKTLARVAFGHLPAAIFAPVQTLMKYRYTFGHYPNIFFPKTFNEKIQARKIFDRRPILSTFTDKFAVRDYVVGKSDIGMLPTLHHVTTDPDDIPFDLLPQRYVVKASHGSGWVRIVKDNATVDRAEIIKECKEWLSTNYFDQNQEWVYKAIPPRILIEEFLDNGCGEVPDDYKLYVFDGKVRFIQVDLARFGQHRRKILDADWNPLPVRLTVENYSGSVPKPAALQRLVRYAEELAGDIDFVRVDLYAVEEKIYFGEMTPTSGNGFNKFVPASYDKEFGSYWTM